MGKLNQRGLAHLLLIFLILLVLAGVGLAAFRVLSKRGQDSRSTGSADSKQLRIDTSKLKYDKDPVQLDPIGDQYGPYYHDIYTIASPDGLTATGKQTLILEKASVPDIIKLPSGQLVIYAVDGAQRSNSGVLMAVSEDDGKTWQAGSAQISTPRGYNAGADPEVVLTDDDKLRLYYVVFPGPVAQNPTANTLNKVYSAVSTDGISFKEEEGVRFEYQNLTDPDVAKIGNTWFMYLSQGPKLLAASSTDGLSFTYQDVVREMGSVSNTVPIDNGQWRQYYCGLGIQSALSSNGSSFSEEGGTRVDTTAGKVICDPGAVQLANNQWLLIYKVGPANAQAPRP